MSATPTMTSTSATNPRRRGPPTVSRTRANSEHALDRARRWLGRGPADAMPAVSNSNTTASGVTIPRWVVAIGSLRYRRRPTPAPAGDRRGRRPLHRPQPGQLDPPRGADARLRRRSLDPRPGRRARAALPAHVGPPVARPHRAGRPGAGGAPHPPRRHRGRSALRHPVPLGGRVSPASSPRASRRRCGTPRRFVGAAALLLLVPAFVMGAWLANSDAALDASGPDAAAGGLRRGRLRGVLLLRPRRAVRHRRSP